MTECEHIGIAWATGDGKSSITAVIAAQAGVVLDLKRPEAWKPIPGASKYEVSDKGRVRRDGHVLATRPSNSGYALVNYTDDTGKRCTGTVHRLVLLAFEGPCPPGKESLHGKLGPLFNWWPEGIRWGTKEENEAEKEAPPVMPAMFDCRYHCGAQVAKSGSSCGPCSEEDGRKVARMLRAGMNLEVAAVRIDRSSDWAYKIAVKHGGYTGTKREAHLQSPNVTQRIRITLRDRRAGGWGHASGDVA